MKTKWLVRFDKKSMFYCTKVRGVASVPFLLRVTYTLVQVSCAFDRYCTESSSSFTPTL